MPQDASPEEPNDLRHLAFIDRAVFRVNLDVYRDPTDRPAVHVEFWPANGVSIGNGLNAMSADAFLADLFDAGFSQIEIRVDRASHVPMPPQRVESE